ncbi:MAG: polysaccharide deacetylase family protein [Clostridia bacterium]|nr:polysaccharide deacetylase family protein [Clostridia bacterium]MBQ2940974.1 polysaccharide deacetylase family protein [Clostridia bacterium]
MKKHGQKWVALLLCLLLLTGSVSVLAAKEEPPTNTEEQVVKKKEVHVPILLYHHITDEALNGNDISMISPFDFRMHMMAIKENFTPISLRDYYEYVTGTDEKATIPDNPIIITFDDGYLSNYEIAYPILKEFKIPATIFVVTDTVGEMAGGGKVNYSHFTWEQAKEMERSGLIEIHSHTASHAALSTLSVHDLVLELRKSKYDIEKNLNRECDMIAFPYGSYNQAVLDAAERAGYRLRALVDDKTSADDFEVNLVSGGVGALTRMTVSGNMGNVDLIENIKKACKRKPLSIW